MVSNVYNIKRARGGKHDEQIKRVLLSFREQFLKDRVITINLSKEAKWTGIDEVTILNDSAIFHRRIDHTWVPVAIKAAVRVLHALGFRGRFVIRTSKWYLEIRQLNA